MDGGADSGTSYFRGKIQFGLDKLVNGQDADGHEFMTSPDEYGLIAKFRQTE